MNKNVIGMVASSLSWCLLPIAEGQQYPEASLEQATFHKIGTLGIERLAELDEEGLQAEYQWVLGMARLCLGDPESIRDREAWWTYATEFQRHAGRTARYRGFGEQAIEDYETAIGYAYESARLLGDAHPEFDPEDWEKQTNWRDIADTYFMMSAYELAAAKSILILERERLRGKDSACDLDRLARITQRQGRFADAVSLQRQAVEATRYRIVEFLEQHPELNHVDPDEPWDRVVFLPEVERVLDSAKPELNDFREVYYRLGRALRLNGQLAEAEHALATASKTPWVKAKFYRQNLDLYVDREWALLALAKGEAGEALGKAQYCLDEYVMSPGEKIELLDLVSRAKEALGDVGGAMEALEAAIEIVETRRANLVTDQFKQSYAAGYAELYRRALDHAVKYEVRSTKDERESREQGRRKDEVRSTKDERESREQGRGKDEVRSTKDERGIREQGKGNREEGRQGIRNAEFGMRNMGPRQQEARSPKPEARPADHESRTPNHESRATSDASRFTNDEGRPAETPAATAFEWAERVKGRAMLDAINRYDQRMKHAIAGGHTEKMKAARRQMREVVSIEQLQDAEWWSGDTALLEFAYGGSEVRSTKYEGRKGQQGTGKREEGRGDAETSNGQNVEMEGSRSRGVEESSEVRSTNYEVRKTEKSERSGDPPAVERTTSHEPPATSHGPPVYLWVVTKDDASFHRLGVSGGELDRLCSMLSGALTGGRAGTAGGDAGRYRGDAWVEPAAKLYEHTIKPIADRLRGVEKLVIVGDGKLRTVPFEVFISSRGAEENRYIKHRLLIEDYAIGYAPSATTLQAISTKTARADSGYTDALWAFASTKFGSADVEKPEARSPKPEARPANHKPRITGLRDILRDARSLRLDDLPNTRQEVERIAGLFPQGATKTWINQENMKQVLLRASDEGKLKSVRFLHFATHAFVDESRPYLCGLVLSPPYPARGAGESLQATKVDGQAERGVIASNAEEQPSGKTALDRLLRRAPSGGTRPELLTLHELAGLDLRSELVVLSACQSLGGRAIEGDWINGLARSFLIAGSSGVLCTLWKTGDKVSSAVVPAIYHAILDTESSPGRIDVPRALQQHKISTLTSSEHGHPSHWAPFIYHGRIGCEGQEGK